MPRSYFLVDPGLTTYGLFSSPDPSLRLTDDECVRCLSYVIARIGAIYPEPLPQNVGFEVIPVRYHHFGEPYPCVGMYETGWVHWPGSLTALGPDIGGWVEAYIKEVGLRRLVELSAGEALRWRDVLQAHKAEPPAG